ncbi:MULTISPECIES: 3'-5' exoribonuclease YhaM family protein [Eubacterium]|uniref:3'-5' exoribonuclease n=1 Tax=Eubacterium ruminantium TaxID=42322 RepID=A0A1T4LAA2_9FIRM|nr:MULTISPECIES: HD domain-containing protein [Eubacterium]MCR5368253.1 HD domain-containing protein [Eubacterium sp.]SCW44515.1 3'-5' exoribonuclease [Eubacterium ruminantium]SDM76512.1 3'-5' exoribonuclease [Eubacterium ruminantium]SJZ51511.1 3'-5' exoribonuclease [Eubacterium ruminantium]
MKYIENIIEGDTISEVYFCKNKVDAKTKAGKSYYSVYLQDKTGVIDGKIWDLNNGIEHFETNDYIKIDGVVTSFNGSLQLNIKRVRRADEREYDVSDYMPVTKNDSDKMYDELLGMIDSISNKYLKELLKSFFVEDKAFIEVFRKHSAAKSVHHGFIGGLLQHSLSVAKLCDYIAGNYYAVNRDLLITSALLHDIGKTIELSSFPLNDYTDEGQLIGHIVEGAMMVRGKIDKIEGFPKVLSDEVIHCILAHHGELEYGSPKKPAIIEAQALSLADNMDAKLQTFTELLDSRAKEKEEWMGFNKLFDSNLRKTTDIN